MNTAELDRRLFAPPFILIGPDNHRVTTAYTRAEADSALVATEAAAIVGTLRAPALGVDVDPSDAGAAPEAGDAAAEDLVAWLDYHGLAWCRRASGRPGHHHVIALVPQQLAQAFREQVNRAATHHRVSATARSSLRLLTTPHRHGLHAPVLAATLTPDDLPPAPHPSQLPTRPKARHTRPSPQPESRSEREFGDALACARAGWNTREAWLIADLSGTKAREIGQRAWRRWFWAPATTLVAAEQQCTETQAWQRFQHASPPQARHLGRERWRTERWLPALAAAAHHRPRRHRLPAPPQAEPARASSATQPIRVDAVRAALFNATNTTLATRPRLPHNVRPTTLLAALHALAEAIVNVDGSMAVRSWAEKAHLDPKSVRRARDVAVHLGLITRRHTYRRGLHDCDAWTLTPALAAAAEQQLAQRSPTPYTPVLGAADTARLQRQHHIDRRRWHIHELTRTHGKPGPQRSFPPPAPRSQHWRDAAACRGRIDLDFIEPTPADEHQCRQLCAQCPVRRHCQADALTNREPWGIWGGLNAHERAQLAARTGTPTPRILPPHGTNARYAKHRCGCNSCRAAHTDYERKRRRHARTPTSAPPQRNPPPPHSAAEHHVDASTDSRVAPKVPRQRGRRRRMR